MGGDGWGWVVCRVDYLKNRPHRRKNLCSCLAVHLSTRRRDRATYSILISCDKSCSLCVVCEHLLCPLSIRPQISPHSTLAPLPPPPQLPCLECGRRSRLLPPWPRRGPCAQGQPQSRPRSRTGNGSSSRRVVVRVVAGERKTHLAGAAGGPRRNWRRCGGGCGNRYPRGAGRGVPDWTGEGKGLGEGRLLAAACDVCVRMSTSRVLFCFVLFWVGSVHPNSCRHRE